MIVFFNDKGKQTAEKIAETLCDNIVSLREMPTRWAEEKAVVFVGAMGICVRSIAPLLQDKHTDPAVVCVDSLGTQVISVLSGHVGGANELTKRIASILNATPVITTQSDVAGLWALDTLYNKYGWEVEAKQEKQNKNSKLDNSKECCTKVNSEECCILDNSEECFMQVEFLNLNEQISLFVNGEATALLLDYDDEGTQYMRNTLPENVTIINDISEVSTKYKLLIAVTPKILPHLPTNIPVVHYIPKVLTVGIGLAHQAQPAQRIISEMWQAIEQHGFHRKAVRLFATIDIKADEPVVKVLQEQGYNFTFFTSEVLSTQKVPNPSVTVASHVGTASVSEAAALLSANQTSLVITKQKGKDWTLAACITDNQEPQNGENNKEQGACEVIKEQGLCEDNSGNEQSAPKQHHGHIEIVGAGPGDPELISVRGRRFLEAADLILYAGSLVPKALTECHKEGAVVRSSADMNLEEQFQLMKEYYDKGGLVVRLHTGDPCIYGAIQEQMNFFDQYEMDYHITPGISSFLAAAAELRSQFTIPEKTQTIILTRGEGRTPMPEKEQLHLLARSQSTMCIFLSASIVEQVQEELLQSYPPETPVAACYHLTWKDQRIYRGQLKNLANIVRDNGLTLTTMIVVGEAIDNRSGFSKLYDKGFSHLFRK